ncbi:hypothetical protein CL634_05180 [bacterium]|nr:hypothetical protein [bacterium]|tara:strand:- start:155 stop:877 length:723 start_codon:yes stop_codon:yes gene_type:complete
MRKIDRDKDGLIKGIDYSFTEDGLIDWRKMVKLEHLVPNKDRTSETDVAKLKDYQLIILLGGIKELAQIRGYTDVHYEVTCPSSDYVAAVCRISWTPNYETEGREVIFSAIGDASPHNTNSFASNFLGPIAENRAFVRCVRNFLKINIVGKEELGGANSPPMNSASSMTSDVVSMDPRSILQSVMNEKGVSFNKVKEKLLKEGYDKADSLSRLEDIPKLKVFELIDRLKKARVAGSKSNK